MPAFPSLLPSARAAVVAALAVAVALAAIACAPGAPGSPASSGGLAADSAQRPLTGTLTPGVGVTATAATTGTGTPRIVETVDAEETPRTTPPITSTRAITATATRAVTATATMTATPSRATETPTPGAGPTASIALPFAARNGVLPAGRASIVWGAQFASEDDPATSASDIDLELPRLKEAGVKSVRMHLRWKDVEPERRDPPSFDWSTPDRLIGAYSRAGMDVVVSIVDYPAWAMVYRCGYGYRSPEMAERWRQFVGAAAVRYDGSPYRVAAWEIGNEVDGKTVVTDVDGTRPPEWGKGEPMPPQIGCWGDRPAAYLAFLKPAYGAIKAVDPDVPVTFGNLAYATTDIFHRDFLDLFLDLDSGGYFDYVGYHWFPELREFFPAEPTGPEKYRMIADRLARHGLSKPIWITETYRRTEQGSVDSERDQVRYLTEELPEVLACCPVARVYWFAWTDFSGLEAGKPQRGIVRSDHTPKLAFPLLRYTIQHTDGAGRDISADGTVAYEFRPTRSGLRTIIARRPDGSNGVLRIAAQPNETAVLTTFPDDALRQGSCCPQVRMGQSGGYWEIPVGARANYIRIVQRP